MAAAAILFSSSTYAFDLSSLLGNAGSAVSGLVEGLLTKEDIEVKDMVGTWTATGSAVTFQSENALKKAGGSAMAGTIESQLNPYYEKYGLIGSTITIQADGTFQLKVKGISIKGTIEKTSDGNFNFNFTPFGGIKLGSIKAFVQKPINGLDIMFDATKLKNILSAVAGFTGNSLATTAASVLDSYEGLCVGFAYKADGSSASKSTTQSTSGNTGTTTPGTTNNSGTNSGNAIEKATNVLKGLFGF